MMGGRSGEAVQPAVGMAALESSNATDLRHGNRETALTRFIVFFIAAVGASALLLITIG